jgi:hypothetical protein
LAHYIQLAIAPIETARILCSLWPELKALSHNSSHILFPLDRNLIDKKFNDLSSLSDPNFELLTANLRSFFESTSQNGALAYIETEYHGGQGGQSAIVFLNGKIAMAGITEPSDAINRALRLIGVRAESEGDEFTNVGLGMARNNDGLVKKLMCWNINQTRKC